MQIIVVEQDVLARSALKQSFSNAGLDDHDIYLVQDMQTNLKLISQQRITMVILGDVCRGQIEREQIVKQWLTKLPCVFIVIYSDFHSVTTINRFRELGVTSFVCKSDDLSVVVPVLMRLHCGGQYCSPEVNNVYYPRVRVARELGVSVSHLDVLHALFRGLDNNQMAYELGLSPSTIFRIRRNLREKLGVETNEQVLYKAIQLGLIETL